ncbi:hypothetical protein [Methylocapsa sp. S129]|uniref:hypothetical protein n=1 Tax=Methylocapsa sp. S129 TaxID=1641869 RepID=UPI00131C47AC|nr:hypothetical protein [Methylocapsa sp. S129]
MLSILADGLSIQHGPISCLSCFPNGSVPGCTRKVDGWRIDNDPGYWGAAHPEVLVLGFSKGANQRSARRFDEIAFRNARSNLAEILGALGLIKASANIEACFTAAEPRLGFASVIRCGLGKEVGPGRYATSGPVARAAIARGSPVRRFFDGCTERFLGRLPSTVRVVILLGLDQPYVEALFERVRELYPSVRRLSQLAYATATVTFAHVIHPSSLATSHRKKWLRDDQSSLAAKRRQACTALGMAPNEMVVRYCPTVVVKKSEVQKVRAPSHICSSARIEDLVDLLRLAMRKGILIASVIENQRTAGRDLKKLFRLRRADGEEFAIQRDGLDFCIWSSVLPADSTPLAEPMKEYPPTKTRHANLGAMPKLRGPKKDGTLGARAWMLRFSTPLDALNFIVQRRASMS